MLIYLENDPAKFHPDANWKDGALGFFEERRPNKNNKKNNKTSSDIDQELIQKRYLHAVITDL